MMTVDLKEEDLKKILKRAYKISKNISSKREKVGLFCDIADVMLKIGNKKGTKRVLKKSIDRSRNMSSASFKALSICDIADILEKLDKRQMAEKLLDEALQEFEYISFSVDQKARALGEIAGTLARIGELEKASTLARNLSNKYGKAVALTAISEKVFEEGREKEGKKTLQEALELAEDIVFSLEKRARALTDIAKVYSKIGDEEKALDIAESIPFSLLKKDSIIHIARNSKQDHGSERTDEVLDRCLSIARNISKDRGRASVYSEIARAMIENGREEAGEEILDKALKLTDDIALPQRYRRVISLCDIAAVMKEKLDEERAYEILEKALQASAEISNDKKQASTLVRVCKVALK